MSEDIAHDSTPQLNFVILDLDRSTSSRGQCEKIVLDIDADQRQEIVNGRRSLWVEYWAIRSSVRSLARSLARSLTNELKGM